MSERSSPARVSGKIHREVTVAGHKFILTEPDRVKKASEEEKVIIAKRLDMYEAMITSVSRLPDKFQERALAIYIDKVVCGMASSAEWDAYYKSWWNLAFDLWCALDKSQKCNEFGDPKTLLEGVYWAYDLLNELSETATRDEFDNLKIAIRQVSQRDALGNLSGSATEGQQQTAIPSTEAIQQSTASSPSVTTGPQT